MEQKNWDDPGKKRQGRLVMESRRGRNGGISVEIVCSIPAAKSLINSRLVRNRLEGQEKKKI